tara:strand:- start:54 stop:929 length:876 start_codon:yes stop_codon:yes gene_type:complete
MKRILFLGSTGFLGSEILTNISDNYEILEINYKQNYSSNKISTKKLKTKIKFIQKFKPEIVIDFAWYGIPDYSLKNALKNVNDKLYIYDLFLKIKSIKKIIVAGSCMEYMNRNKVCVEKDKVSYDNYLNWSKLSVMNYISNRCSTLKKKFIWLRIFYAYGEGQRRTSIIPHIINSIISKKKPNIKNMNNYNDYIHKKDISFLVRKIITKDIESGVYNIGTGKSVSVNKICSCIYKIFKIKKPRFNYKGRKIKFLANIDKISKATGWKPKIFLNEKVLKSIIIDEKKKIYNN